jgi:uncharacterized protein (TIGR00369 family)
MSDAAPHPDNGWGSPRSRQVTWYDPAISAGAARTLTGREFLQAIVDGDLPRPPMAELMGSRLVEVDGGYARFECTPDESLYNPLGIVHGGALCTLLDSAAGCAVHTLLPTGVVHSSIEIKVSFFSPARAGDGKLEVEGRALKVGRQVAFAEAHARVRDGKLVAHATTSIAVMNR